MEFLQYYNNVLERIAKKGTIILATSAQNRVSARAISVVVDEGKIFFQTSEKLLKYQQIVANKYVALTLNNIQIEGIAEIKEPTVQADKFRIMYKEKHANSFQAYSNMKSSRVIEVTPTNISEWIYVEGEPYQIFANCELKELQKIPYKHTEND